MALVGGINLMLTPQMHAMTGASGMLAGAADQGGRCRAFDNAADGFVPGEGVGVVVLKRLDRALADGDRVYAVIAGSGVNQDGKTSSITAPSAASQAALETAVHARFDIPLDDVGLINQLAEPGGALEMAKALARRIIVNAPLSVAATKRVIVEQQDWPRAEMWTRQAEITAPVLASHDAREGAAAFAERRPANWTAT